MTAQVSAARSRPPFIVHPFACVVRRAARRFV